MNDASLDSVLQSADCPLTKKNVQEVYKNQRGVCRICGLPFGEGIYKPVVSKRVFHNDWSEENAILVLDVVEKMRCASSLPWRQFVRFMQTVSKEVEL